MPLRSAGGRCAAMVRSAFRFVVQLLKGMYVKFRQDHQRMERSKKSIPITVPPTDICCMLYVCLPVRCSTAVALSCGRPLICGH